MNICVVGTGYVGLVTGACFAEFGNPVICVDNNKAIIDALEQGKLKRIGRLFRKLHPARIAGLLESVPAADRRNTA